MSTDWIPANWLETLDKPTRTKAQHLLDMMRTLGAPDAEEWVYSEIAENIPQVVSFRLRRLLWNDVINTWQDSSASWIEGAIRDAEVDPKGSFADAGVALKRLEDIGADPRDLRSVARYVSYASTFNTLLILDCNYDGDELGDKGPTWALVETDEQGDFTGRRIDALYESLLSADPSGNEGR